MSENKMGSMPEGKLLLRVAAGDGFHADQRIL